MSRIQFALTEQDPSQGRQTLEIRQCIHSLIVNALKQARVSAGSLNQMALVGNTVMHHLFCGIDVEPLSHVPFAPMHDGLQILSTEQVGWKDCGNPAIRFLPCLGGFVGSDILAGVVATHLATREKPAALIDLGTNGEIVVGNKDGLLCASTAAGPAFEAGRIRMGMRASLGAITGVAVRHSRLQCHVLGNIPPRGICGSGLVDAVAAGLELGAVLPGGRLANGLKEFPLLSPVALTQGDIRELQLAKAAIAAGLRFLLEQLGAPMSDLDSLYLAGAFGNYINRNKARRIGLLDVNPEIVHPSGNTALQGVKMALLSRSLREGTLEEVRSSIRHVSLGANARFQDLFVENMNFPNPSKPD